MPRSTPETDSGTDRAGPLGPARRSTEPTTSTSSDYGWQPVPGKPWMERHVDTGRMRTRNYQPSTPLKKD